MKTSELPPFSLPSLAFDAHKYSRGSLLVLAGSKRFSGAGVLVALASERTGSGYTTLATPVNAAQTARCHMVSVPVLEAREDEARQCFEADALRELIEDAPHPDALCCGPGLTVNQATSSFLASVIQYAKQENTPLLLDADALTLLAREPGLLSRRANASGEREGSDTVEPLRAPLILTPHAGELARLLKGFNITDSTGADDTQRIKALSRKLNAVVVAKGPLTRVCFGNRTVCLEEASPALAKAGTGDVLAGVIASLLAQGMDSFEASLAGVRIHSKAGMLAEDRYGRRSVTALDVVESLPDAIKWFECEPSGAATREH